MQAHSNFSFAGCTAVRAQSVKPRLCFAHGSETTNDFISQTKLTNDFNPRQLNLNWALFQLNWPMTLIFANWIQTEHFFFFERHIHNGANQNKQLLYTGGVIFQSVGERKFGQVN